MFRNARGIRTEKDSVPSGSDEMTRKSPEAIFPPGAAKAWTRENG